MVVLLDLYFKIIFYCWVSCNEYVNEMRFKVVRSPRVNTYVQGRERAVRDRNTLMCWMLVGANMSEDLEGRCRIDLILEAGSKDYLGRGTAVPGIPKGVVPGSRINPNRMTTVPNNGPLVSFALDQAIRLI